MAIQIGDHVRFRAGMAPFAFKVREGDIGVVVAFTRHLGPAPWAMVQFKDFRTSILPEQLEVVGELLPADSSDEMAS